MVLSVESSSLFRTSFWLEIPAQFLASKLFDSSPSGGSELWGWAHEIAFVATCAPSALGTHFVAHDPTTCGLSPTAYVASTFWTVFLEESRFCFPKEDGYGALPLDSLANGSLMLGLASVCPLTWSTRVFGIQIAGRTNSSQLHLTPWMKSNAPIRPLHLGQYIFPSVHCVWERQVRSVTERNGKTQQEGTTNAFSSSPTIQGRFGQTKPKVQRCFGRYCVAHAQRKQNVYFYVSFLLSYYPSNTE